MKLIYAGNNDYGLYAAEDLCGNLGIDFVAIQYEDNVTHHIENLEREIINAAGQAVTVDLSEMESPEETVTETIDHIRLALNCNIIIFCPGFDEYSKQIASLQAIGITNYIYEGKRLGVIKEALIGALENPIEAAPKTNEEIIRNREQLQSQILGANSQQTAPFFGQPIKKIGIVGCMPRIGTTTTALQLVKHLNLQAESSACYIQMQHGYVEAIRHFYNVEELSGSVMFNGLQLYDHPAATPDILKAGYTCLVYDYGSIDTADTASLLERDIIVAVGSTGPDELSRFPKLIELLDSNPVTNYVLNSIAEADRPAVLKLMRNHADKSHFLEYTPDPFVYNVHHKALFDAIMQTRLPLSQDQMDENKPRKRLFGRMKK